MHQPVLANVSTVNNMLAGLLTIFCESIAIPNTNIHKKVSLIQILIQRVKSIYIADIETFYYLFENY